MFAFAFVSLFVFSAVVFIVGFIRNLLGENKTHVFGGSRPNSGVRSWTRK